ncbi:YihY/virulence factor BrkB family protein [Aurantiacibacter sp. MUD61]|uniref:YihY/virulence factor BrkB family protein n=1 Tax=Aurantiacibacter sp. MUD61 TaxID=3009083 RepID=UPI0022F0327B|nr:YihY/virulence factor BrkB family protein [Aurantiacibacter sp. MUD61]
MNHLRFAALVGMGFIDRLKRAWSQASDHNTSILAAGVAFYAFLALVPLLASVVLSYGLLADPATVADHLNSIARELPQSAAELIGTQLESIVETSGSAKGLGLLVSLAITLVGVRSAANTLITAIATAFDDQGNRSFIRANLLAIAMTIGAILGGGLIAGALAVSSAVIGQLPDLSGAAKALGQLLTYTIVGLGTAAGAGLLYRIAPPSFSPGWKRVLPGALLAGFGVLVLTAAFGFYVANFGSYNATYGSLGAVVVLLTWLYLSAYVVLFGGEVAATEPA